MCPIKAGQIPWLTVEEANDAAVTLRRQLGPEATELLNVDARPEHAGIIKAVENLLGGPGALSENIERAEIVLQAACLGGGVLEPGDDRSDVPWCALLRPLMREPKLGSAVARRWFRHLLRLQQADEPVSVVMEGMAAYAIANFENLLGGVSEYERWMLTASNATDHEPDRPWLSLVVLVRAARLLAPRSRSRS